MNPETAVSGTQSVSILADAVNGTLLYDLDAGTKSVITDFSAETSLVGKSCAHRCALPRRWHIGRNTHLGKQ